MYHEVNNTLLRKMHLRLEELKKMCRDRDLKGQGFHEIQKDLTT